MKTSVSDLELVVDPHLAATSWCNLSFSTLSLSTEEITRLQWGTVLTEIGSITVVGSAHACNYLGFSEDRSLQQVQRIYPDTVLVQDRAWAKSMVAKVWSVWQGHPQDISRDITLSVRGTPFQMTVWQALMRIPKGHVVTYGTIAATIDRPRALRAVGRAVGANPVSLLIPCHRVIPKQNGSSYYLGNYMWGRDMKQAFLEKEMAG